MKKREDRYWNRGVMTVFFSLLSVIFLALLFMLIESARYQGARAQTANIVNMGNFSVFGEFEKRLLEDYELFAVDAAYGTDDYSIDRVNARLKNYMLANAKAEGEGLSSFCFDLWRVSLLECRITEYALLSDRGGEYFYQQAVSFMENTAVANIAGQLMKYYQEAMQTQEKQKEYEQQQELSASQIEDLEQKEKEKTQELAEGAAEGALVVQEPPAKVENPLPALLRLKRKDILSVVCPDKQISSKKVTSKVLSSKRRLKKGNMKLSCPQGGLVDDLLFREYLMEHFPAFTDGGKIKGKAGDGKDVTLLLDYQMEYILGGKNSDRENLKAVAKKLLLLREGCNYASAVADTWVNGQAEVLAWMVIGWLGIPALTEVLKHAILIGWSYAESMMDVRILFDGGHVPLFKSADTWEISLENLASINEILALGGKDHRQGYSYKMYLRLLLNMQSISAQKERGLDLVELNLKTIPGLSNFRADHCVVGILDESVWEIPPLFGRVTNAFLQRAVKPKKVKVQGGFAYD